FTIVVFFASNAPAKAQLPPHPAPPQAATVVEPQPVIIAAPTPEAPVAAPTAAPAPAAPRKPTYNSCNVEGSIVAITFDDGPHPKLTPRLLDMLKERNIKATFFVIGKCVAEYPDIAKRIVDEGHEIANHSWSHPQLTKLSASAFDTEISQTNDAIEKATGVKPTTMRPPYGAINPSLTKRLNEEYGLSVILWSVDPLDWKIRKADHVSGHILKNTAPGSIILAHDIHASTVDAMPTTLDTLQSKGYKFATVSVPGPVSANFQIRIKEKSAG
ncbi:MAG: polysaccharide deacetylase family protein, partial [Spartobacteria bacterium]